MGLGLVGCWSWFGEFVVFWRVFRFCPRLCFGPKKTLPGERPASGYQFILGAVCRQGVVCALLPRPFLSRTRRLLRQVRVGNWLPIHFGRALLCCMVAGTRAFLVCAALFLSNEILVGEHVSAVVAN